MKCSPVLAAILVALGALRAHAGDVDHLRFRAPIGLAERVAEEVVAVRLDAAVAAATAEGFPDVRIVDDQGGEVSRILRRGALVKTVPVRRSFPVAEPRLKPLPEGGLEIEFTIDAEKHPHPIDGFRIDTPMHNFEQRVRVQRLDGSGAWNPVGDEALLYDYSQHMDARQVDVAFPRPLRQPPGGTWRITVDATTIEQQFILSELSRTLEGGAETGRKETTILAREPFRIDRIEAWRTDDVAELRVADAVEIPLGGFRVDEEPKEKRTRIHVTSDREPITGLRLAVADRNFRRRAAVEVPVVASGGRPPARRELASAPIHRVDLRGIVGEQLLIPIPESRQREYEIVVDNGDSPPLSITGVTAVGPVWEAVFIARPGRSYRLAYGGATGDDRSFPVPAYDTAAIELALGAGKLPVEGTLGTAVEVDFARMERPWLARLLGNPLLIGGTIALLSLLLGFSLYRAAGRIERVE